MQKPYLFMFCYFFLIDIVALKSLSVYNSSIEIEKKAVEMA